MKTILVLEDEPCVVAALRNILPRQYAVLERPPPASFSKQKPILLAFVLKEDGLLIGAPGELIRPRCSAAGAASKCPERSKPGYLRALVWRLLRLAPSLDSPRGWLLRQPRAFFWARSAMLLPVFSRPGMRPTACG